MLYPLVKGASDFAACDVHIEENLKDNIAYFSTTMKSGTS